MSDKLTTVFAFFACAWLCVCVRILRSVFLLLFVFPFRGVSYTYFYVRFCRDFALLFFFSLNSFVLYSVFSHLYVCVRLRFAACFSLETQALLLEASHLA